MAFLKSTLQSKIEWKGDEIEKQVNLLFLIELSIGKILSLHKNWINAKNKNVRLF